MSKVRIASKAEVAQPGCRVYHVNGHTLALFTSEAGLYAIDNRCPHMGFPLDKGTVRNGILTCHWHHARFDLASGGAFDLFADDVTAYPVTVEGDDVWVDLSQQHDPRTYYQKRLRDGLEQELNLVIAKAVIALMNPADPSSGNEPFQIGLIFGSRYRAGGWAMGQTINTCEQATCFTSTRDRPGAHRPDGCAPERYRRDAQVLAIDPPPGPTVDLKTPLRLAPPIC